MVNAPNIEVYVMDVKDIERFTKNYFYDLCPNAHDLI